MLFTEPYVDVDEWRDVPVRHRYVHGGFADTETRSEGFRSVVRGSCAAGGGPRSGAFLVNRRHNAD